MQKVTENIVLLLNSVKLLLQLLLLLLLLRVLLLLLLQRRIQLYTVAMAMSMYLNKLVLPINCDFFNQLTNIVLLIWSIGYLKHNFSR
jgi:hypothetical protein